jgi:hypothetical protein
MGEEWRKKALVARELLTPEQVACFEEALAHIATTKEQADLSILYQMLSDRSRHHEVTWGVIHVLELFPPETAINTLFEAVPQLQGQAPEWLAILNQRWFKRRDMQVLARRQLAARTQEQQALIIQCFPALAAAQSQEKKRER